MMKYFLVLAATVLFVSNVKAQEGTERLAPFAHGAGRTYALTARGLDAVEINPALLAYGTPRTFELTIAPFTSLGFNSGSSFSFINDASNDFKSDSAVRNADLFKRLYNNQLSADLGMRLFGLSYYKESLGTFALTWDVHAALRSIIPDSLLGYITPPMDSANLAGGRILTPQHVDVQGVWYAEYGLSYGRNILTGAMPGDLDLSAGITASYVQGVVYMRIDPESFISFQDAEVMDLEPGSTNIQTQYKMRFATPDAFNGDLPSSFSFGLLSSATAGSGFGVSLGGVASEHPEPPSTTLPEGRPSRWRFALSVADIGSIRWTSHTDIREDSGHVAVRLNGQGLSADSISSYFRRLGGTLDTTDAPFTSSLPTTLHVAGEIDMSMFGISMSGTNLLLASEFALGLTDVVGSPKKGRFGIAAILDYPSNATAIRTALGATIQDGATHMTFALGTTLWRRFSLDFGSANILGLLEASGPADFSLGMKWMF
jgi:hypothetical protein